MDRSLAVHHEVWRLLLAALVAFALVTSLGTTSVSAASKGCSVKNKANGRTYSTLQAAVNAAKKGAHLTVKGTCKGGTVISKSLTITGVRTRKSGHPTLSGADRVRVLKIDMGARVKLGDLAVVRGRASVGAGIHNRGTLVLANVQVRQNQAVGIGLGGGIRNYGTVRVNRTSQISANYGSVTGGVENHGTFALNGRSVVGANRGHHVSGSATSARS